MGKEAGHSGRNEFHRMFYDALWERSELYRKTGQRELAERDLDLCYEKALKTGDRTYMAWGYIILSNRMYMDMEHCGAYEKYIHKALDILRRGGDRALLRHCYNNLANIMGYTGRFREAMPFYLKALKVCRKCGLDEEIPMLYNNMGILCLQMDDADKAEEYLEKAIALSRTKKDLYIEAFALIYLSIAGLKTGRYGRALAYAQRSLEINEKILHAGKIAQCLNIIGHIYQLKNEHEKALPYFMRAYRINSGILNYYDQATNLINAGNSFIELDRALSALKIEEEIIRACSKAASIPLLIDGYCLLGNAYWTMRNKSRKGQNPSSAEERGKKAMALFNKASALARKKGLPLPEIATARIREIKENEKAGKK